MSLEALGWDGGWVMTFAPFAAAGQRPGRVVAVHRETSIVRGAGPEDRAAVVSGRFRHDALATSDFPAVGDWVALDTDQSAAHRAEANRAEADADADRPQADGDDPAVIAGVLPRRSAFRRSASDASRGSVGLLTDEQVIAANVDIAFLVAGLDDDFNLRRMERYLAVAWASGVTPVIVLNKSDIAVDTETRRLAVSGIAAGVPILTLSARTGDHLADLGEFLVAARTSVVLGSSGVGKSTLVNALLGEARQATAAVREDDSRGRHTTTHRELFALPGGALLIDTPGIRSLEVVGADAGLDGAFDDIAELAASCRFSDCGHGTEPGCAIRTALASGGLDPGRLVSYRKLERESAHAERKVDPRAQAEERRRWKTIHKAAEKKMLDRYGNERR